MSESTNKVYDSTNNLLPNTVIRGSLTMTFANTGFNFPGGSGLTAYSASNSVILENFKSDQIPIVQCWEYRTVGSNFYNGLNYVDYVNYDTATPIDAGFYYLTKTTANGISVFQLNVKSYTQEATLTSSIVYYTVMSANVTESSGL